MKKRHLKKLRLGVFSKVGENDITNNFVEDTKTISITGNEVRNFVEKVPLTLRESQPKKLQEESQCICEMQINIMVATLKAC